MKELKFIEDENGTLVVDFERSGNFAEDYSKEQELIGERIEYIGTHIKDAPVEEQKKMKEEFSLLEERLGKLFSMLSDLIDTDEEIEDDDLDD